MDKELQKNAVDKIKRIADELGHVPSRDEARPIGLTTRMCESFGLYGELLKAAGLTKEDTEKKERAALKSRIASLYTRDIRDLSRSSHGFKTLQLPRLTRTVIVGDLHLPFSSSDALMGVYSFLEEMKNIEHVIQIGDLYDMLSFTKFPRSHLNIRPDEEIKLARKMAEEFWISIRRMCPHAKLTQMVGNHDMRPHKRILESGAPELEAFFNFKPWFEFDGVHTIHDAREPLVQDEISFIHGFANAGAHRAKLQTHVVHGHHHRGGLIYSKDPTTNKFLFELDVGYLGDLHSKAFTYTPVKELKWTHGLGFISEYGPHWVPFT